MKKKLQNKDRVSLIRVCILATCGGRLNDNAAKTLPRMDVMTIGCLLVATEILPPCKNKKESDALCRDINEAISQILAMSELLIMNLAPNGVRVSSENGLEPR